MGFHLIVVALFCQALAPPPPNCSMPALTVGPRLNSSKDLTKFVKKHKKVLVGFSADSCTNCCLYEPLYEEALSLLPAGVKWARVDLDRLEAKGLASTHDIETLPAVVMFRDRLPTRLLEPQRPHVLASFAERVLTPLQALPDPKEWADIQDPFRHVLTGAASDEEEVKTLLTGQFVRVLALLGDDDLDEDDLEELTDAARTFANLPLSVRFWRAAGSRFRDEVVSDPLVSAACASSPGRRSLVSLSLFHGEYVDSTRILTSEQDVTTAVPILSQRGASSHGVVLNVSQSGSDKTSGGLLGHVLPRVACRALDSYDGLSIQQWALRASLPPVGIFDTMTSPLYEKTQKPFLMMFVDTARPELTTWLKFLHNAHLQYNNPSAAEGDSLRLIFVYIDGKQFAHRMASLGLVSDERRLPALSFNYVTERLLTWQPPAEAYENGTAVLTAEVVNSLVQQYLHGDGALLSEAKAPRALDVPKRNTKKGEKRNVPDLDSLSLDERLRFVFALNQESFQDVARDSAKDVAVFFYASSGPYAEASKAMAIYVNRCAERFEELGIQTVRITRLDMARFTAPTSVQISEVPCIALFPAFSKDPPHKFFRGKLKVQYIMWWIEAHASRKVKLPELPHLDEIESKAYWEQKAEMDEERQRHVASVNEKDPNYNAEL